MFRNARIAGVGRYIPQYQISTEDIAKALPGSWDAEMVIQKVGVKTRYFLNDLDVEAGRTIPSGLHSNDMAYYAARNALKMAGVEAGEVDGLIHVTCTPDEPYFSFPAIGVAHKLGLPETAYVEHFPSGCGGAMMAMRSVRERILGSGGEVRRVLLVASNYPSAYFDRRAFMARDETAHSVASWLSLQLFGDGAGAFLFEGTEDPQQGFVASTTKWSNEELVTNRGGGAKNPSYHCVDRPWMNTYFINGKLVEQRYREFMSSVIPQLLEKADMTTRDIHRYFLHPANRRLVEDVVVRLGVEIHRAPINVDVIGNTSAAATPILMSISVENGETTLGSGQLVLLAALGAGVHAGAHLFRI